MELLYIITLINIHIAQCQQHESPLPSSPHNGMPPMNRPTIQQIPPDRRGSVQPVLPRSCASSPCQNGGTCVETKNSSNSYTCKCRPLYLGGRCEQVIKSPNKLKLVEKGLHHLRVSWTTPELDKPIYGYIVQHHQFGYENISRSEMIHANTKQYTIQALQENTQYTVCVNILFDNITIPDAVLRDQCLEVKTKASTTPTESLILIAVICGAIFVIFLLLFILVVCCTKKRQNEKTKEKAGTYPSMSWRRTQERGSYRDQSFLSDNDRNEAVQFNDELFHQNQTNNASRESYDDDVFITLPNKPLYMNQHQIAIRSSSACEAPRLAPPMEQRESRVHSSKIAIRSSSACEAPRLAPPMDQRESRVHSSSLAQTSSMTHANYRELPPSISNHMMRSPTTRDKDASGDFDMGGSYFIHRS